MDERLAKVQFLLDNRDPEVDRAALRALHPAAPEEMINSAHYHIFTDGVDAAVDWLVAIHDFQRNPSRGLDSGDTFHVLYHLYNWLQLQALMPEGRQDLVDIVAELKQAIEEDDLDFVKHVIGSLDEVVNAGRQPPQIE
jgi:hypothetical protein